MAQKFTTGITVRDLASAASDAVAVSVAGDTNDRIKFEAGGKVVWGSGASAGDVNLYRDAADRLKTDDALQADGGLITVTTAGTPTLSLPDGALAIDTTNNLLYIRTNSTWEIASGGGASVTTSDGAPVDPEDGDLWYETDTGSMFVYYDDGTSQQWVEVGTAGVIAMTTSDTAPSTPSGGDLWFDTSTAKTYVYYAEETSSQWVEIGAASAASHGEDGYIQFATGGTFNSASALVWDNANSELEVTGTVIADGLTVDTSTLVVDAANNRVGIGTATPSYPLDVVGDVNVSQSITVSGDLTVDDFDPGQAVFHVDSTDNRVGIGTKTPSTTLDVDGTITATELTVSGDLTVDTDTLHVDSTNDRVGIGTTTPSYPLEVDGAIQAERYRGENALVLNNYTTANPSSNVYLYSPGNDRDAWIYLDSAATTSNWGIYHRQIDSTVGDVPANSVAFVGGGSSAANAYISLQTGEVWSRNNFVGGRTVPQIYSTTANKVTLNTSTPTDLASLTVYAPTANTKFFCTFHTDHNADTAGAWKRIGFYFDGTLDKYVISSVADAQYQDAFALTAVFSAGSVGNHTVAVKAWNGTGQSSFAEENNGTHCSVLLAMAVQY